MRPAVGVGALLMSSDGTVLIGHRIKAGENPSWCLPGGHVEADETFEDAARREIAEETGIRTISAARVFALLLDRRPGHSGLTACVHAETSEATASVLEPDVFASWIWADPRTPPSPLFPASAALLALWNDAPLPEGWAAYRMEAIP
jgi:8-oxo-dGTP diphosphatase